MGLFGLIVLFVLHVFAIYFGTQVAQLEYADVWRSVMVAFLSYIAMLILSVILLPLFVLVPFLGLVILAGILCLGTAVSAKVVFSCDWQPAFTIGGTVAVLNLLGSWMLSGCS